MQVEHVRLTVFVYSVPVYLCDCVPVCVLVLVCWCVKAEEAQVGHVRLTVFVYSVPRCELLC